MLAFCNFTSGCNWISFPLLLSGNCLQVEKQRDFTAYLFWFSFVRDHSPDYLLLNAEACVCVHFILLSVNVSKANPTGFSLSRSRSKEHLFWRGWHHLFIIVNRIPDYLYSHLKIFKNQDLKKNVKLIHLKRPTYLVYRINTTWYWSWRNGSGLFSRYIFVFH